MSEEAARHPSRRRRAAAFIAVVLATQIGLALRYYGDDHDRFDERFAWRMYSSTRLTGCTTHAIQRLDSGGSRRLELERDLVASWRANVKRNRDRVIRAVLLAQCETVEGTAIIASVCRTPVGDSISYRWEADCGTAEVTYQSSEQ